MNTWNETVRKIVICAVIFSLTHVPVWQGASVAAKPSARPLGRLTANGAVTVNNNPAHTGDTIFPGSLIETQGNASATVQMTALGQLDLLPNSSLSLRFDPGTIQGDLTKGCAVLRANTGVKGQLRLPRGGLLMTKENVPLRICADDKSYCEPTGVRAAKEEKKSDDRKGVGLLLFGFGMITGSVVSTRGNNPNNNPSPSAPQQ